MDKTTIFNNLSGSGSWQDKVLGADQLWGQVKTMLGAQGIALPATPRRPDVRMIINNISGHEVRFKNPGDHSGSKEEKIAASGDSTAVMVMVKGATLSEQYKNAETLYQRYNLNTEGLSYSFIADLKSGAINDLIAEAYGPAPFQGQTDKLVDVSWTDDNGATSNIKPQKGANAAFGARAATSETVFLAQFHIYVKGTGTTPELVESSGMTIAVSSDRQTGAETTRPIVPSVAKTYYGEHFANMPVAIVHPDGMIKEIRLKNKAPASSTPKIGGP